MNKREVVICALEGRPVPYVPWNLSFTCEAQEKLMLHYNCSGEKLDTVLDNHFHYATPFPEMSTLPGDRVQDFFGVIWDQSQDKDIGVVENCLFPEPDIDAYQFPSVNQLEPYIDAMELEFNKEMNRERAKMFAIGFSLFERAWTLRGMENLLMDFIINPEFVRQLLSKITDFNIACIERAASKYQFDIIHFGDDWGQQHGLIMGPQLWHEFIFPELKRMYAAAHRHARFVSCHSCGDVDELFDDLVSIGLNCFNPFQPEVMNTFELMKQYAGKLSFWGGLSTQQTLPYGSVEDVRRDTQKLIKTGMNGNYIFSPAHAVESDVPLENMLEFINLLQAQPGYKKG